MLELQGVQLAPDAAPLNHTFAAGQLAVVLGANRAGKTDLCRLIMGLGTVARGRVLLEGCGHFGSLTA